MIQQIDNSLKNHFPDTIIENGAKGYKNAAKWDEITYFLLDLFNYKQNNISVGLNSLSNQTFQNIIFQQMFLFIEDTIPSLQIYQPKLFNDELLKKICLDIVIPSIIPNDEKLRIAKEISITQNAGKSDYQGMKCFFCGCGETKTATASLIGRGTEKFSNQLIGGKNLGDPNKAYVCSLCEFEALLRYMILGTIPQESILITPEFCISPNIYQEWRSEITRLINIQKSNVTILNNQTLAQIYQNIAQLGDISYHNLGAGYLISNTILGNEKKKKLIKCFSSKFQTIEAFNELFGSEYREFNSLVDDVFHGKMWDESFNQFLPKSEDVNFVYDSPNFIIILIQIPFGTKEPESQAFLRKLQIGILISILFNARVKFLDSLNPILPNILNKIIDLSFTPLSKDLLFKLVGTDQITLVNRMKLLQKICIYTTIESRFEKTESDFLLKYLKEPRGRILNKFFQKEEDRKQINSNLLALLSNL